MWQLGEALVAGLFGIFFTHRVFVKFVLATMHARAAISRGEDYEVPLRSLISHAFEIAIGIFPLVYGVVRFADWAWNR
jgi:hypothetical protein